MENASRIVRTEPSAKPHTASRPADAERPGSRADVGKERFLVDDLAIVQAKRADDRPSAAMAQPSVRYSSTSAWMAVGDCRRDSIFCGSPTLAGKKQRHDDPHQEDAHRRDGNDRADAADGNQAARNAIDDVHAATRLAAGGVGQ